MVYAPKKAAPVPHRNQAAGGQEDNSRYIDVLVVEDDPNDALLITQALHATSIPCGIRTLCKGDEVLPYMMRADADSLPDLIMLDMGLPGMNGFEILEGLAGASAAVRAVPIAILTGFENFEYMIKNFKLPFYGYLTKPVPPEKMQDVLTRISILKSNMALA